MKKIIIISLLLLAGLTAAAQVFTPVPYDKKYHIGIETERYEFFLKNGYVFNHDTETSLGWIVSGSWHNQDGMFGHRLYNGLQKNIYSNLIFETKLGEHHKLSTGLSINYDKYDELLISNLLSSMILPNYNIKDDELVSGAYAEYSLHLHDKFIGLATLPMQDTKLAVQELERCMNNGFRGVQIGSNVNNLNLHEPQFDEFFAACENLNAAILVHPWQMMGQEHMTKY